MGEQKFALKPLAEAAEQALVAAVECVDPQDMRVSTPGGVFHIRWDDRGGATAMGQLPFFAEYLNATGLFEDWVQGCPLNYVSPNAPGLVDVLGTWMLSILDGHNRYAHVGVLRGDGVAPSILGMKKIIGDDSLRRALSAIAPAPDKRHTAEKGAAQQALSRARHAVDAGATHAQCCRGAEDRMGARLRHDDQTVVWPPGWGRAGLQPAQTGSSESRHSHLLDWQSAAGVRRAT